MAPAQARMEADDGNAAVAPNLLARVLARIEKSAPCQAVARGVKKVHGFTKHSSKQSFKSHEKVVAYVTVAALTGVGVVVAVKPNVPMAVVVASAAAVPVAVRMGVGLVWSSMGWM